MKKKYIFGNWKMSVDSALIHGFVAKFAQRRDLPNIEFGLAVPFVYLDNVVCSIDSSNCLIGAQNVCEYQKGAYTGEISAEMLADIGAKFCLVGHSERRHIFNESNLSINHKIINLLDKDIIPLLCIGETLQEYEQCTTKAVLAKQLEECLQGIDADKLKRLMVAYEPVWAIGTGKTATTKEIADCVDFTKDTLHSILGDVQIPVLYGGSVNDKNAGEILSIDAVDGALIGGASLDVDKFLAIADKVLD